MRRLFTRLTDEKVRVVPPGLAKLFQKPAPSDKVQAVKNKFGINLPYFLYAGTIETRKNLLRLVHGFLIYLQQSEEKAELILAGAKGWIGEEFMQFILSPALKGKVRWIGVVEPEELWGLYTGAEAFAYPALSEGFGMPILEAMGCGAPVLYASNGALPELAGDAGLGVGASDVGQWAGALLKIHRDQDLRDEMRHRGFARSAVYRWEKTAQQTLTSIVDAAKAHG
jgi:glycosyltransferase involved in cell wall biosynthesis